MIIFNKIPIELFEIAASFQDSDFLPSDIWLLDTQEYQLWIPLKCELDVGIYVIFRKGRKPKYRFHECYAATMTTEFKKWTNREETISKFCDWYLEAFGYQYYKRPDNWLEL